MDDPSRPRLTDGYWLTDGTDVYVTAGRYAGEHGHVVNRAPDLRPGCAWIDLGVSGTHLLVSTRLAPHHH